MIFWKYKVFTRSNSLILNTAFLFRIFHPYIDLRLCSKVFSMMSLNLTVEPFKWSINSAIQLMITFYKVDKKKLSYPAIHILFVIFCHFDFKDVIQYTAILSNFLHFLWKLLFPGKTPVPPRSGTWILDLSHYIIWAIWLAEVRKCHQHYERIFH